LNANASGAEINREVKSMVERALSIYEIDTARLAGLRPDLILTQSQCEVCAVSLVDLEKSLASLSMTRPKIISVAPARLVDVWKDIQGIADALAVGERGRFVLASLKERVVDVIQKTCLIKNGPKVACLEWLDPLMGAGNWVPELVQFAGGQNLFGEAGQHSTWLEWDALSAANPDVIILIPCGFNLGRTVQEAEVLKKNSKWRGLRAVKSKKVFAVDGNQFFNRPCPRLVESLEILAEIFHPKIFPGVHAQREKASWCMLKADSLP
jgi:iron complex transport system substrate-binding protein